MRKGFSFDDHVKNGKRLKTAWSLLMESQSKMCLVMPKGSRPIILIQQTLAKFGALRSALDSQVGIDCPEQPNDKLNHAYYGLRDDQMLS